jgi:heme-degrading monooxygenase HmoA
VHARVTFAQVKPDDIEDSARLFAEGIPAAREEEGFRGALFLVRDDGTVMAIDLADSLDHLRANEKHGLYQAEVAKFRSRIVGHPHREFFRIAVSKGIQGGVELLEDAS